MLLLSNLDNTHSILLCPYYYHRADVIPLLLSMARGKNMSKIHVFVLEVYARITNGHIASITWAETAANAIQELSTHMVDCKVKGKDKTWNFINMGFACLSILIVNWRSSVLLADHHPPRLRAPQPQSQFNTNKPKQDRIEQREVTKRTERKWNLILCK